MHVSQLLFQIATIVLLGAILTRLLRRVGQPSVIAEILAGIALGPSLLGWLWPAGLQGLFPEASLGVLGMIAQLGLVFFMFLVGLEFDPRLIQGQVRSSIVISNTGIVVPFVLGAAVAVPLHAELAPPGVAVLPFALFLGTAMSITAFPVLARILTESRLIRTRVGAVALAAAAVDDVTAWCLLALVVGVTSAQGIGTAAVTTAMALGYTALVWFVVRPILARIGPRAGQNVSTEVVGLVFLALLASSLVTEWIGVHALFGSFVLGAAMPREGPVTSVLTEKMEDFVTVVFLPLFFAYSGLRTQIGLLDDSTDWLLCGLLIGVASLGKFGGVSLVSRLGGFSWRDSAAIGILMNTRGLMELVVLNVGLDLGVISERLFTMMVIMALVTTWITSPLLQRLYPRLSTLDLPEPAPTGGPEPGLVPAPARGGVLVCLSDPAAARSLATLAHAWCQGGGGTVWALHLRSIDRPQDYLRDDMDCEPLEEMRRCAQEMGFEIQAISFPSAQPADDIVRVAALKEVPLVLLGVHRDPIGRETLGGLVGAVLQEASCDVAVLIGASEQGQPLSRLALRDHGANVQAARRVAQALAPSGAPAVPGALQRVLDESGADLVVQGYDPEQALPEGDTGPAQLHLLVRGGP
jgi:Kef-type K+ transport system membrane component KefB